MLRTIILSAILFISTTVFSQAYKDSIKTQFLRYTDLLVKKDIAKSMDYMNPELFKIVPKQQLIAVIEKAYNDPDVEFGVADAVVLSVGDNKLINGMNYVKLQYSNAIIMRFKGSKQDPALIKKALEGQFGAENVKYDAATENYRIVAVKDVIANSADKITWKFIAIEERQKPMLEKFIPKELL